MGILKRIVKVTAALLTSNVVNLATKLLLPPIFLFRYGTTLYGEWIALSGAVAYLSTLNFGIQTYVTQDLTIRYQQKDLKKYHLQQSTALRILLGILMTAGVLALGIFALPVQRWLRLTIPQSTAALALYLLALQVLCGVLFNYFTGMFTVLSRAHAGVLWANSLRMTMVICTSIGAWMRLPFSTLAALQLGTYVFGILLILMHVRRIAPEIFPSLREWDRSAVHSILRPSGYFGLISMSTFLSYEMPILILQRELGPFVVVAYSVMRTIFSMCRHILNAPTQAMGPEVTRQFGRGDWGALANIYNYSERLMYALLPMVNLSVLMISPVLLEVWLHKPELFAVVPYVGMAAISITLSAKEHKFQFQYSTNTHERLARIMFLSYIALIAIAIPMVHWLGMLGFVWSWLVVEIFQVTRMIQLNRELFVQARTTPPLTYVFRLAGLSVAGLVGTGLLLEHTHAQSYPMQIIHGIGVGLVFGGVAFALFDTRPILREVLGKYFQGE